jgi:hypothetical protein
MIIWIKTKDTANDTFLILIDLFKQPKKNLDESSSF